MTKPWARSSTEWATEEPPKHPAKFSKELLPVIAEALKGYRYVLDPMAGVGTLAWFLAGSENIIVSNEMEMEWAMQCPEPWTSQDARALTLQHDSTFDAIATSPAYGNRMADKYAGDKKGSTRHTYRTYLGRELSAGNGAALQWGDEYRRLHADIWRECYRVLRPGGRFVVNVKDHIRKGVRQQVPDWHMETLLALGLRLYEIIPVLCPGQRHGENGNLRVDHEFVMVLDKPERS